MVTYIHTSVFLVFSWMKAVVGYFGEVIFQSRLRFQPREWSSAWKLSIDDVFLQYFTSIRRINDKQEGTVLFSLCVFFSLWQRSSWLFRWSYFSHSCDSNQRSDFVHEKLSIDDVFPQYLTRIRRITYKREGTVFFPCVFFFSWLK